MNIFEAEYKQIRATGYIKDDNKFVVLKGSHIIGDAGCQKSLLENDKRMALRTQLIRDGILVPTNSNYLFSTDFEFNSPSEAASIIWGYQANGRKEFGVDGDIVPGHTAYYTIDSDSAIEGYKQDQKLMTSKRDRELANKRKEMDNYTCQACDYRMKINERYIVDCHHLNPVAIGGERETTINDLVSLCPTCHRISHTRNPIYTPKEVKQIINSYNE